MRRYPHCGVPGNERVLSVVCLLMFGYHRTNTVLSSIVCSMFVDVWLCGGMLMYLMLRKIKKSIYEMLHDKVLHR